MLSIHANYSSLLGSSNLNKINQTLAESFERLTTGKRINSAKDDKINI